MTRTSAAAEHLFVEMPSATNPEQPEVTSEAKTVKEEYEMLMKTEMAAQFTRPKRENRKRPTLFAFNTCHQCKRNQSMDDLIVCSNAGYGCDYLFCYACLKKNRLVSITLI